MTEDEAKALASELEHHRAWRVEKVVYNPRPSRPLEQWPYLEDLPPTWEVHLTHRQHPHFFVDQCISSATLPGDQMQLLPMILRRDDEETERRWQNWHARNA